MISSSSFFLTSKSFFLSSRAVVLFSISSFLVLILSVYSLIRFSHNSTSRVWNSISLVSTSNSRLLRTLSCCCLYFSIEALAVSISIFLVATLPFNSSISPLIFSIRVVNPVTSSSKSCTSSGNSPRSVLILSISDNMVCN